MIEELAGLPVQLRRNMRTFVEIGKNLPMMANDKSVGRLAVTLDQETKSPTRLDHLAASANQA